MNVGWSEDPLFCKCCTVFVLFSAVYNFWGHPDWSVVWENWKIESVENQHDLKLTETQLVSTSAVPAKQLRQHKPNQNLILKQNDMQTGRWNGRKPSSSDVPHTPKCHTQDLHGSVQKGAWWTPNWLAFCWPCRHEISLWYNSDFTFLSFFRCCDIKP